MINQEEIVKIKVLAKKIRKNILKMSLAAGASSSHFGGGLSIVDITATLYCSIMNYKKDDPWYFLHLIQIDLNQWCDPNFYSSV